MKMSSQQHANSNSNAKTTALPARPIAKNIKAPIKFSTFDGRGMCASWFFGVNLNILIMRSL